MTLAVVRQPGLNREQGEHLEGLGGGHKVVPADKWKDTPFWAIANVQAAQEMAKAGALLPIVFGEDGVLVQEYEHNSPPCLVFIFCRAIAGEPAYSIQKFEISQPMMVALRDAGLWSQEKHH